MRRIASGVLGLLMAFGMASGAMAQDASDKQVAVELNKLEPLENSCRAYLVFRNPTEAEYRAFKLELAVFDTDGVVQKLLAVDAAPLRAGRTTVKLFDFSGVTCERIDAVLLNHIPDCASQDGDLEGCIDKVAVSSKAGARFYK